MRKTQNVLWLLMVLLFSMQTSLAQEAVVSAGGAALGMNGSAAYSIGQAFFIPQSDLAGTVSPGVQQAYEIFSVGIEDPRIEVALSVFPNPTADQLTLTFEERPTQALQYELRDMNGRLLQSANIMTENTIISLSAFAKASYLLTITHKNTLVQSFKILKN